MAPKAKGKSSPKLKGKAKPAFAVHHHDSHAATFGQVIDAPDDRIADVKFLVGGQHFGGLRSVLGLKCEVLRQMLHGGFKEADPGGEPVHLRELDPYPGAFRQFLFYMHAGSATLDNVRDVIGLFEISKYFGVIQLNVACTEFIQSVEVADKTCVMLLNFAVKHDMDDLTKHVVQHIAGRADEALADADEAAHLPMSFLRYLYQANDIDILELTLVQILLRLPGDNQRVLLPLVRLPRISAYDMMKIVVPSGLFDKDMCLAALAYRENPLSVQLPSEVVEERTCTTRCFTVKYCIWGDAYLRFIGKPSAGNPRSRASSTAAVAGCDRRPSDAAHMPPQEDGEELLYLLGVLKSPATFGAARDRDDPLAQSDVD